MLRFYRSVPRRLLAATMTIILMLSLVLSVGFVSNVQAQDAGSGSSAETMTSCALENIGWIACPVIRAAARASDYAFTFISQSFMQIEVSLLDSGAGTVQAWSIARNIANALTVLFLLYIIYGVLTGRGISNTGIKRMLPRIIVAVILVNLSFFLGQIAVDISNIIGSSIQSAMSGVAGSDNIIAASTGQLGGETGADGFAANDGAIARVTSAILSSPNLAWVLLVPLVTVVMSVGILTSVMIVVLIIRKVLIVALMLLAPIAFVLYLLPNTEQYFSRWFRMFTQLLLLFPVMAVLLGAGQIVGSAVMSTTGSDYTVQGDEYQTASGSTVSATTSLVAIGATVLPLLGTWYAFRGAMQAMDSSVARLQSAGVRRSGSGNPAKEAERLKRASEFMQRNRSINSKKLTDIQNAVSSGGGGIRRRSKTTKTPEQKEFDRQVQGRLNEIKLDVANGRITASPQQMYINALQAADNSSVDPLESRRGVGVIGSSGFDNIQLKATEAYLLESLGEDPKNNSIDPNSLLTQQNANEAQVKIDSESQQAQQSQQQAQQQAIVEAAVKAQAQAQVQSMPQEQQGARDSRKKDSKSGSQSATAAQQATGSASGDNIPQPNAAIQVASSSASETASAERNAVRLAQKGAESGGGYVGSSGSKDPGVVTTVSDSRMAAGSDRTGQILEATRNTGRNDAPGISTVNPAAISERIPTRLKPISDLEKKAQAIAAKHVASSQEKAGGMESFEDELKMRAEQSSLDPLRALETFKRPSDRRKPGQD